MWRTAGSVVVGYIAMALFIFLSFSLVYVAMGADRAYQPGTYEVSGLWMAVSLVLGLLGAVLGGWICLLIAKSLRGPQILAAVVFVLGLVTAFMYLGGPDADAPTVRDTAVGIFDAMQYSRTPNWINFANIVVGVVGVLLGAKLGSAKAAAQPEI